MTTSRSDLVVCPDCDGDEKDCRTCNSTGQVVVTLTPGPKRPA